MSGALGQLQAQRQEGLEGYKGRQVAVPKTWFENPHDMLDDIGLGYQQTPSTVTYETLRVMAQRNSIVGAIIQTRTNQVAGFCQPQQNEYGMGFEFRHRDKYHKLTASDQDFIKKMTMYMLNTGVEYSPDRDDFESFTRKVVRDRMIFDQMNWEMIPSYDGLPHSFHAVDASTIRMVKRNTERGVPMDARQSRREVRYKQVIEGVVKTGYTAEELAFCVANPRTDIRAHGYGMSELEILITSVTYHLFAEQWNQRVFSQGSTTKGLINIRGNIPQVQMDNFKRQWLAQVSGVHNAWRTPIINSESVEWIPLQPSNTDMGYQEWLNYLIKIIAAIYLIDPAEFNFDMQNAGSSLGQAANMSQNEAKMKVSKDRGLQPLLRQYFKNLNKYLVWPYNDQWEIFPAGLDAKTEEQAIELLQKSLQSHVTLNEVRAEEGRPPLELGDIPLNPVYITYLQHRDIQRQQEQQAKMGLGPDGQPLQQGQPPQGGVPPDQAQQGQLPPQMPGQQPEGTPMMQEQGDLNKFDQMFGANPEMDTESAAAGESIERLAAQVVGNEGRAGGFRQQYEASARKSLQEIVLDQRTKGKRES